VRRGILHVTVQRGAPPPGVTVVAGREIRGRRTTHAEPPAAGSRDLKGHVDRTVRAGLTVLRRRGGRFDEDALVVEAPTRFQLDVLDGDGDGRVLLGPRGVVLVEEVVWVVMVVVMLLLLLLIV